MGECPICELTLVCDAATCTSCGAALSLAHKAGALPVDQSQSTAKVEPSATYEHIFERDEWQKDEEGREKAKGVYEDNQKYKEWLQAKIKRIASSTNPKVHYLVSNKSLEVKLLRKGNVIRAEIKDVFIKQGVDKIYARLFCSEGAKYWDVDTFDIVDINARGAKPKRSSGALFLIALIAIGVLTMWMVR